MALNCPSGQDSKFYKIQYKKFKYFQVRKLYPAVALYEQAL
ncbi:hypothetical protein THER_0143 [Thermodesulfovibrio sp. N1]|nr:hypothetical protein THER_0143 [Thermodesulfovibrio sp. N1]